MNKTAPGAGTAYRSHKVKITGSNIMSYDLKISGPTNLTPSNGASTVVSGADGKTGAEMSASGSNIWGYAWGEDSEAVEEMTYNTVSNVNGGTTLACDDPSASYDVDCERKLVFGANFNTEANPGTYTATVNLALTATPAVITYTLSYNANGGTNAPTTQTTDSASSLVQFVISGQGSMTKSGYNFLGWSASSSATVADTNYAPGKTITLQRDNPSSTLYAVWKLASASWSNGTNTGISNMQDINTGFCNSSIPAGSTIVLKDNRGSSPISYKILKMKDGTCWMAENLRLMNTTIDSMNSDMTSGSFTIPASNVSGFTDSDKYQPKAYYNNDTIYGAYYNWYTATAGAGSSSLGSGSASTSICPKGWKLPTQDKLVGILSEGTGYKSSWTSINGKYGYKLGYDSNDAFWPAVGYVYSSSLKDANSSGYYWASESYGTLHANALSFDSYGVNSGYANSVGRSSGRSIRCVASY